MPQIFRSLHLNLLKFRGVHLSTESLIKFEWHIGVMFGARGKENQHLLSIYYVLETSHAFFVSPYLQSCKVITLFMSIFQIRLIVAQWIE